MAAAAARQHASTRPHPSVQGPQGAQWGLGFGRSQTSYRAQGRGTCILQELQATLGFPEYFATADKFALPGPAMPDGAQDQADAVPPSTSAGVAQQPQTAAAGPTAAPAAAAGAAEAAGSRPLVEADAIIAGDGTQRQPGAGERGGQREALVPEREWSEAWRSADRCALYGIHRKESIIINVHLSPLIIELINY